MTKKAIYKHKKTGDLFSIETDEDGKGHRNIEYPFGRHLGHKLRVNLPGMTKGDEIEGDMANLIRRRTRLWRDFASLEGEVYGASGEVWFPFANGAAFFV